MTVIPKECAALAWQGADDPHRGLWRRGGKGGKAHWPGRAGPEEGQVRLITS